MKKQWYVVSNNTSWCNVEKAVLSGPYTTKEQALSSCYNSSWTELLTAEEAEALTY